MQWAFGHLGIWASRTRKCWAIELHRRRYTRFGFIAEELAETQKSLAADEAYLTELNTSCAAKASEWAARQKQAAEEQAAIEKAKAEAKMKAEEESRLLDELAALTVKAKQEEQVQKLVTIPLMVLA